MEYLFIISLPVGFIKDVARREPILPGIGRVQPSSGLGITEIFLPLEKYRSAGDRASSSESSSIINGPALETTLG